MYMHVSLASMAMAMWKYLESPITICKLTIPSNFVDYEIMRSMYFGGRTLATVSKYDSDYWSDLMNKENRLLQYNPQNGLIKLLVHPDSPEARMLDNNILHQLDVVSLYPSEMFNRKFPLGTYKFNVIPESEKEGMAMDLLLNTTGNNPEFEDKMIRTFFNVDLDADENMLIAFLMRRRKSDNKSEQTLAPLRNHWLTGVELVEAIIVGYKLLKIHVTLEYEFCDYIFKNYIGKVFQVKDANKANKTSAMYQSAKLLMNALSGRVSFYYL